MKRAGKSGYKHNSQIKMLQVKRSYQIFYFFLQHCP